LETAFASSRSVLIERLFAMSYAGGTEQQSAGTQMCARPQVQAGLAIGTFVKEPFDEEARKNMFGQRAKDLAGRSPRRHSGASEGRTRNP
jgi:hypothetical protein